MILVPNEYDSVETLCTNPYNPAEISMFASIDKALFNRVQEIDATALPSFTPKDKLITETRNRWFTKQYLNKDSSTVIELLPSDNVIRASLCTIFFDEDDDQLLMPSNIVDITKLLLTMRLGRTHMEADQIIKSSITGLAKRLPKESGETLVELHDLATQNIKWAKTFNLALKAYLYCMSAIELQEELSILEYDHYFLSFSEIEPSDDRHNFPNKELRTIRDYTERSIVAEKSAHLPEPSPRLRFSIQVPVYNEMPWQRIGINDNGLDNDLGNLPTQMRSIVNAIDYYITHNPSATADEIEILYNINNSASARHYARYSMEQVVGTLNNDWAIEFLELLSTVNPDQIHKEIMKLEFIGKTNKDFFIKLATDVVRLRNAGCRFNYLDCTDGKFIAVADNSHRLLHAPNQAVRRLLLSDIGIDRLDKSRTKTGQACCFMDADIQISMDYFEVLDKAFRSRKESVLLATPVHYNRMINPGATDSRSAEVHLGNFLSIASAIRLQANIPHSYAYLETQMQSPNLVKKSSWGMYEASRDGGLEDTNMVRDIKSQQPKLLQLPYPITTRNLRIRNESWEGGLSTWKSVSPTGGLSLLSSFMNNTRNYLEDVGVKMDTNRGQDSVFLLPKYIMNGLMLSATSDAEKALVNKYIDDKSPFNLGLEIERIYLMSVDIFNDQRHYKNLSRFLSGLSKSVGSGRIPSSDPRYRYF